MMVYYHEGTKKGNKCTCFTEKSTALERRWKQNVETSFLELYRCRFFLNTGRKNMRWYCVVVRHEDYVPHLNGKSVVNPELRFRLKTLYRREHLIKLTSYPWISNNVHLQKLRFHVVSPYTENCYVESSQWLSYVEHYYIKNKMRQNCEFTKL